MRKVGGVMQNAACPTEELDTPKELAKALKVTPPTVMDWFRRGIIPAEVALGRIYRFDRAKCKAALAARQNANREGAR
jgi:excisionase family DNA binding protein